MPGVSCDTLAANHPHCTINCPYTYRVICNAYWNDRACIYLINLHFDLGNSLNFSFCIRNSRGTTTPNKTFIHFNIFNTLKNKCIYVVLEGDELIGILLQIMIMSQVIIYWEMFHAFTMPIWFSTGQIAQHKTVNHKNIICISTIHGQTQNIPSLSPCYS